MPTENYDGSGWPKLPKKHFRGKFWFYSMIVGVAHLKNAILQSEGPFEANTSHPILLIGNTAGVYN